MSSVRRVAFAGAAAAMASGALLVLVASVNEPRPVDVRRVDLSPVQPGVLSATHTTTLHVAPSTTVVLAPPVRRPDTPPPPPPTTTTTTPEATAVPVTSSSATKTKPKPPWLEDRDSCDPSYRTDGMCVPWLFPLHVRRACDWLLAHGVKRIELVDRDRDRHRLDLDRNGIGCERTDLVRHRR